MPTFKEDSILIVAPGSHTTIAQLGLPESLTPPRGRYKSRMFPSPTPGKWEPHKIRAKAVQQHENGHNGSAMEGVKTAGTETEDNTTYEEDIHTDEGAVWPISGGKITNWECFYALMEFVYKALSPPFHTAVLVIAQPAWTLREHERITEFFFQKFKIPAFALVDAAPASCYAFGLDTACVVDVGADKADVTTIVEHLMDRTGRSIAVPGCGGEAMTLKLCELLKYRDFTRDMCEQLKMSSICEILPLGTPLPGSQSTRNGAPRNPAALASIAAQGSGPDQRSTAGSAGDGPRDPSQHPEASRDEDMKDLEDNEGVLDVASIVASGKMGDYLERKEREKTEKNLTKSKKAGEAGSAPAKPVKLKNSEREQNVYVYDDHKLSDTLKGSKFDTAEVRAVMDDNSHKAGGLASEPSSAVDTTFSIPRDLASSPRRELKVATERFLAASGPILTILSSAIYYTILSNPYSNKRSDLWNNIIIVGNGANVRGFKEALLAMLHSRFLISPSSATMFTSELPSNFSTPMATGANTPTHPHPHGHGGHGGGVNPLLLAATHAQPQMSVSGHLQAPISLHQTPQIHRDVHSAHGQTPTSIKLAKLPEYFPEWKDVGCGDADFLGAQVTAKVIFVMDHDQRNKAFMTRSDYNESGPPGIHEFTW